MTNKDKESQIFQMYEENRDFQKVVDALNEIGCKSFIIGCKSFISSKEEIMKIINGEYQ
jgi:hypothetical protein